MLYADPLARDLMESDPALREAIASEFGREAYHIDGTLNRPYLADTIFSEDKRRKRMNAIVHPFVFQALDRIVETEFVGRAEPYVLIEAALIYESGLDKRLDAVLLVDAPLDIRAGRVAHRDGLTTEEIRRRFQSQLSAQVLRKKADFVLDNIGDISEIRPKVAFLDRIFQKI